MGAASVASRVLFLRALGRRWGIPARSPLLSKRCAAALKHWACAGAKRCLPWAPLGRASTFPALKLKVCIRYQAMGIHGGALNARHWPRVGLQERRAQVLGLKTATAPGMCLGLCLGSLVFQSTWQCGSFTAACGHVNPVREAGRAASSRALCAAGARQAHTPWRGPSSRP